MLRCLLMVLLRCCLTYLLACCSIGLLGLSDGSTVIAWLETTLFVVHTSIYMAD
jgi:hypothetical protein